DDGRREMVRVLMQELGYDTKVANDLMSAMIDAGTLRYHRDKPTLGEDALGLGSPGSGGPAGMPTVSGYGGAPVISPVGATGYWEIGRELSNAIGRKGQVDPT
ncbi:MAG: hypothetical protein HGA19_21970, partial [Oscillochloris sp.]|nr:hypothetical protein [Oscillochloris sp.]